MSWIKVAWDTPAKPEVLAIATALGIEPDAAMGALLRLWIWFSQHTESGFTALRPEALDQMLGRPGFCAAATRAGWIEQNEFGTWMTGFHAHTSSLARRRALTAVRVARMRDGEDEQDRGIA